MALLQRLSKEEIRSRYKFKGLAFGLVPVYLSDTNDHTPDIAVRNWIPDWTFEVVAHFYFLLFDLVDPCGFQDRAFPFKITGRIK